MKRVKQRLFKNRMDGQTDRWVEGPTDGRTDGPTQQGVDSRVRDCNESTGQ